MPKILELVLASLCLFACADDEQPPPPTCESLGCENAFCNAQGICSCNGEACVLCARTDAGVCSAVTGEPQPLRTSTLPGTR